MEAAAFEVGGGIFLGVLTGGGAFFFVTAAETALRV
jgi:hypothetical protein